MIYIVHAPFYRIVFAHESKQRIPCKYVPLRAFLKKLSVVIISWSNVKYILS
jgi:hypothetical protein